MRKSNLPDPSLQGRPIHIQIIWIGLPQQEQRLTLTCGQDAYQTVNGQPYLVDRKQVRRRRFRRQEPCARSVGDKVPCQSDQEPVRINQIRLKRGGEVLDRVHPTVGPRCNDKTQTFQISAGRQNIVCTPNTIQLLIPFLTQQKRCVLRGSWTCQQRGGQQEGAQNTGRHGGSFR